MSFFNGPHSDDDSGRFPDSPADNDWDTGTADEQGNLGEDDADTSND